MSKQAGLKPCYSRSGDSIVCDFNINGYRLPTEAEWEFAARGGKKSNRYEYSGSNDVNEVAWYWDNTATTHTHPVAQKKANELGLYDMSGNVWEWYWDWYSKYIGVAGKNPCGPVSGEDRILRGGSCWISDAWNARSTSRSGSMPSDPYFPIGFRLARGL